MEIRKILTNTVFTYGLVLMIFAVISSFTSRLHIGNVLMFLTGCTICFLLKMLPLLTQSKLLLNIALLLSVLAFLITTLFSVFILYRGKKDLPKTHENVTLIVLGAKVNHGRPSRALKIRLDKAAEYLLEHENSTCVVSGGQGKDESTTEAFVMKNYLAEQGVDEKKIYSEDKSTDTLENLQFSSKIIEDNLLSRSVVIVTNRFHTGRGKSFAKFAGFETVYKIPSDISFIDLPGYLFREFLSTIYWNILKGIPF